MPRASRDGVSIAYEVDPVREDDDVTGHVARSRGTAGPDAAPVVFVQGVELGRWGWRWQREAFRGRRRVLVPFLRGTGPLRTDGGIATDDGSRRSDTGLPPGMASAPRRLRRPFITHGAGYTVAALAADLEAVLADDAALGRGRSQDVHLVGQGLGGAIAIQYALEYDRARSLTLVGARHGGSGLPDTPASVRSQVLDPDGNSTRQRQRNRLRPFFSGAFLARNPHLLDRILVWQDEQGPDAATREAQWAAWHRFDPSDRLADVTTPALVIHGTADRLAPVENGHALAERIVESAIELIEGAGHLVGIERPGRVNDRLTGFVQSIEETDTDRTVGDRVTP